MSATKFSTKIMRLVVGGFASLAATSVAMPVVAQEMAASSHEFETACAVCHGTSGRGDGNLVQFLNVKPTDLTKLSANNDGVYPFLRVFQVTSLDVV